MARTFSRPPGGKPARLDLPAKPPVLPRPSQPAIGTWWDLLLVRGIFAARAYACDGHDYHNAMTTPAESANLPVPRLLQLATGNPQPQLMAGDFLELLLGAQAEQAAGPNFCPGMTNCPIASYQHYIVASNREAIADWRAHGQNRTSPRCARRSPPDANRERPHGRRPCPRSARRADPAPTR